MDKLARPLELIEAEINFYKAQAANSIIEIGKRLIEAKEQLGEGERFLDWLKEKVDFSKSTAYRFMNAAKEAEKFPALGNFSPTKIYALLDVPADQRNEFIQQHDLEDMSTREVEAAVKEWKQKYENAQRIVEERAKYAEKLLKERQELESELRTKDQVLRNTQADVKMLQDELKKKNNELKEETEKLQTKLREAQQANNDDEVKRLRDLLNKTEAARKAAEDRIDELEEQLKSKPIEISATDTITVEKVPDEVQKELEELRKKAELAKNDAAQRYKVYFDIIVDTYKKLLSALKEIQQTDPESYIKYRKATATMLQKMGEHVKDEPESTTAPLPVGRCGECIHADMDQVSDEQLDDGKALCAMSGKLVDFEDPACQYYKSIRESEQQ